VSIQLLLVCLAGLATDANGREVLSMPSFYAIHGFESAFDSAHSYLTPMVNQGHNKFQLGSVVEDINLRPVKDFPHESN
jgi:hypothetical protein